MWNSKYNFSKRFCVFYEYDSFACMYVYAPSACGVQRRQKGESDLQELEFQLVVNCHEGWELNAGPPQEQVLLFTEHSLQSS